MASIDQSSPWQFDAQDTYLPIFHEKKRVGFCQPDYARQIVDRLNESDLLQKALTLACRDLARRIGSGESVEALVQRYISQAERPRRGVALIALLLQERQADLDLNTQEFIKFCDSYKLSPRELQAIYDGTDLESDQLLPLSRILGMTVDEVIEQWKGKG